MILHLVAALPALMALQQGPATNSSDYRDQPVVIERVFTRVRFENDGTSVREISMRVRVQSEGGVKQFGQLEWPYSSATETLTVDTIAVHNATGVVRADQGAVQDVTGPIATEAPMYTDLRQKIVTVPALRPGDTLEVHLIWTTRTAVAPGQFWFQEDFSRDGIVLDERLEVDVPAERYLKLKTAPDATPQVMEAQGRKVYRWRHQNFTILNDSTMDLMRRNPPRPSVQLTTYRNWEEVGAWYEALAREREAPNDALRAMAQRLVNGKTTLRDSLAALYDYVSKDFRYVSLSFGIGRYQPHAATEVFANKYGDCKDKHTLLASLLRAVNLHADPVLISSGRDIDPDVPSPAQFDHLISAVPIGGEDLLWLDTTPGLAPFSFLTVNVRNKHALVVRGDGPARMLLTPKVPAEPQRHVIELAGELNQLGTLKTSVRHEMRGDGELFVRYGFQRVPQGRWRDLVQGIASAFQLNGDISDVTASAPEATDRPFTLSYSVSRPGFATWTQNRSEIELPLPLGEMNDSVARDSAQVQLTGQWEMVARLRLQLPAGATARLPVAVTLTRPYGTYRATYTRKGDSLIAERTLVYSGADAIAANPNDYASFLRAVRNDQRQQLVLERAGGVNADAVAGATIAELYENGNTAYNNRDYLRAVDFYNRVLKRDPRHSDAWNDLGRAWQGIGMFDSAEVALRKQVEINPFHQFAWNNLGLSLWRQHKYAPAEQAFLKQLEINPLDQYAHSNLGGLYLEQRKDSAAAAQLTEAAAIRTTDPSILVNLGKAHLGMKLPDSARADFERAIAISASPTIWNNIAYVLADAGVELVLAEKYARQAIDATEANLRSTSLERVTAREWAMVRSLASFWDTIGWIYFRQKRFDVAEAYILASWQLSYHGEVGDHLAEIQMARGRQAEAIKTLAQALAAIQPVANARTRLTSAALGRNVDALAAQGRKDYTDLRTVHVKTPTRDVAGRANLLFSRGGALEDVKFVRDSASATVITALKRARYPVSVPDSATILVPRQAVVICEGARSDCAVTILEADRITP